VIHFACPTCQKRFAVAPALVGRGARCPCGAMLTVPPTSQPLSRPMTQPTTQTTGSAVPAPTSLRSRRLGADEIELRRRFPPDAPVRVVAAEGTPPVAYEIEFDIQSLEPSPAGPVARHAHRARIELSSDYPRVAPLCRMLTPVFHPNIDRATICIGDHWAAGEHLGDLVLRIAEMLAYQAYNIRSPLDAEAAMWADLHTDRLPTDPRDLRSLVPQ
jgi:ubiquitin-protein ligase